MQVFILLLLSHVTMVTAIDGCYSDRDKDHRPRENCTAAGFTDVPAGFQPSTKVLLFPRNLFSSLTWSSFQMFTEIYEIDLTDNKLPQVTPSVSPVLPSLSVLRLGSNCLASLPEGSFSACPHLTELYLGNNKIKSLNDHTFSGLSKLEILDLSSNYISMLPKLLLHPLSAIETLFLENNKIKVMPDDWFSQKMEVPYLYLSANPWACSCSLGYLRMYLEEYESNVYTRDGPEIKSDAESVVCDSPAWHKNRPVILLEESDLCSPATELGLTTDFYQPFITQISAAATPATITTSSPPPPTTIIMNTAGPSPPSTSTATPQIRTELSTVDHSVVTWYQSFTTLTPTHYSVSDVSSVEPLTSTPHSVIPSFRPQTESPPTTTTTSPTMATKITTYEPSPTTSATQEDQTTQTIITTPSWVVNDVGGISASRGERVFCFWLFAACLMVCVTSVVCVLVTLARLVIWYRAMYKPLRALPVKWRGGIEGVRLLTLDSKEVVEGGVSAHYRSILIVHTEGKASEEEQGGEVEERPRGEAEAVTLELTGGDKVSEKGQQRGNREEAVVYRKTLYRLIGKEEAIGLCRDVMEEYQVSAEAGEKAGHVRGEGMDNERSGEGASRQRYRLILREEVEQAGGGKEELDWVVGGWEFRRGGIEEEPRSSLGQWLANYLPSMPWGVTTPHEREAAHLQIPTTDKIAARATGSDK